MVDQMALQMQQAALETQLQSSPRIHTSTPFSLGSLGRMASLGVSDSERQNNQKLVSLSPSMVGVSLILEISPLWIDLRLRSFQHKNYKLSYLSILHV